ncbi:MAG TPA: MBL fold metallo-hydrolase [Syntrophales bacterium]|nr:MBL fold metallo-hydrolase [Syntrophales bacterium]HRS86493.1 MBL fold metallo-hydrolase [Syntrophales bacterium]
MIEGERHFGPVWFIPGNRGGRYPYCHSLFLEGPGIIIDPASNFERLREIRNTEEVKAVWLSHWHEDHFTYLDLFDDLPLFIAPEDQPPFTDVEVLLDWYGLEGDHRDYWRRAIVETFHYRPRPVAGFLQAGPSLLPGGLGVEIIPTPGHTPGHLAFHFPELGVVFMGDYDLTPFGPWYGDRHSSISQTLESLDKLASMEARVFLTGHERGVFAPPEPEDWQRYRRVIFTREEKLLEFLKTPHSLEDIVLAGIVYGKAREPKAFFEFGERAIMKKHLEALQGRGEVFVNEDGLFERRR